LQPARPAPLESLRRRRSQALCFSAIDTLEGLTVCNLYHVAPENSLDSYIRRHLGKVKLPASYPPPKLQVAPFDTGMFMVSDGDGGLEGRLAQWGMIRSGQKERIEYKERPSKKPGGKPVKEPLLKNNARLEGVAKSPAFRDAWKEGRRCLIPALWLREPNWQSTRCTWWHLSRADGLPWMVAGIWSEWTDPESGELVPNCAFLTFNVNSHPLLNRLHRPEVDRVTKRVLPLELQDKRGEAHIEPADWTTWLNGTVEEATRLLVAAPNEFYDQGEARAMDQLLAQIDSEGDEQLSLV
jgi:putative SOS response-associated peptidase YedK